MRNATLIKKRIIAFSLLGIMSLIFVCFFITGCSSCERSCKSWDSEFGGLNRIVNVYSYDGQLLASYEGMIDVEENESKVLFDLDGKRYIYYNAVVEVIEK